MTILDLLEVVRLAREFSEEAGWGHFKVINIDYDTKTRLWSLKAELGVLYGKLMVFKINDVEGKVVEYGAAEG